MGDPSGAQSDRSGAAFVKRRVDAPADFFAWEAAGLAWLRQAVSAGGAPVVGIRGVGARHISLDRVEQAPATRGAAEAFGRALASTHAQGADSFGAGPPGWSGDGYIGRQTLVLQPFSRWGTFFAQTRVLPYARAARLAGTFDHTAFHDVERLCSLLDAGVHDDGRPPARIHGDLWGGNVLYSTAGATMIDPAAHGGHGLTDLAMLALFGTPYLDRVLETYAETAGLAAGWRELISLHQLHPLLVHAVSHGPSYGRAAHAAAAEYL